MADASLDQAGSPRDTMADNRTSEPPVEGLVGTSTEAEENETVESETVPSDVSPSEAGSTADGDVQENPESQVAG